MLEAPRIYPTFRFRNAAAMIDWLEKAFGFTIHAKYMDGDKVAHAELAFGSSMI
ncbi:MAG: glyoxalase, partial [Paracoccus sp. BP8]